MQQELDASKLAAAQQQLEWQQQQAKASEVRDLEIELARAYVLLNNSYDACNTGTTSVSVHV